MPDAVCSDTKLRNAHQLIHVNTGYFYFYFLSLVFQIRPNLPG